MCHSNISLNSVCPIIMCVCIVQAVEACSKHTLKLQGQCSRGNYRGSALKEFILKKTFADNLLTPMSSKMSMSFFLQSKRNQSSIFSPNNALQWEPNGSRSKRQFQCKLQTVQRALNDSRR